LEAQAKIDDAFKDKAAWAKKSILSTAGMGKFSSDRTICEYASKIWKIQVISLIY
jgi:glycogen phosphorylase